MKGTSVDRKYCHRPLGVAALIFPYFYYSLFKGLKLRRISKFSGFSSESVNLLNRERKASRKFRPSLQLKSPITKAFEVVHLSFSLNSTNFD